MKSIIVNNNFWKKKTMFINILAIFAVLLLVLIEQMKTEGVAIKIVEKDDEDKAKMLLTSVPISQTTSNSAPAIEIESNNETHQGEMLMNKNSGQKAEDLVSKKKKEEEELDPVFLVLFVMVSICSCGCSCFIVYFVVKGISKN